MIEEIKSCQFCGHKAVLMKDRTGYYIECDNGSCEVLPTTWYYDTELEAVEAWNKRAGEDNAELD